MKSFFNTFLYLLFLFSLGNSAFSLSENQIKEICQKKPRISNCIKKLKFKNQNLIKGKRIEIPVKPFKE